MKKYIGLSFVALLLVFTGCKDDEGTTPTPENKDKSNFEMATEGTWRVESGTIDPAITIDIQGNVITVDEYWDLLAYQGGGVVQDCDKDNVMHLNADSTVLLDEGPTKCDPNDPQSEDGGTWTFLDNESKIKFSSFPFDPQGSPQTLDVTTLSSTNMNIEMTYEFEDPIKGGKTNHIIKLNYVNTK